VPPIIGSLFKLQAQTPPTPVCAALDERTGNALSSEPAVTLFFQRHGVPHCWFVAAQRATSPEPLDRKSFLFAHVWGKRDESALRIKAFMRLPLAAARQNVLTIEAVAFRKDCWSALGERVSQLGLEVKLALPHALAAPVEPAFFPKT
jgi:hypothetical protein